jgi:hypothetical protein
MDDARYLNGLKVKEALSTIVRPLIQDSYESNPHILRKTIQRAQRVNENIIRDQKG